MISFHIYANFNASLWLVLLQKVTSIHPRTLKDVRSPEQCHWASSPNSLWPKVQRSRPFLVQVIICHLFCTDLLCELKWLIYWILIQHWNILFKNVYQIIVCKRSPILLSPHWVNNCGCGRGWQALPVICCHYTSVFICNFMRNSLVMVPLNTTCAIALVDISTFTR